MFNQDLEKIQKLLSRIPKGKVTTYKALAKAIGRPKAYRYVGKLVGANPEPKKYPCYKVVKSNGELGGYSGGEKEKIRLLQKDGVIIKERKVKNFKQNIFDTF